jgi:hypothetical protein
LPLRAIEDIESPGVVHSNYPSDVSIERRRTSSPRSEVRSATHCQTSLSMANLNAAKGQ